MDTPVRATDHIQRWLVALDKGGRRSAVSLEGSDLEAPCAALVYQRLDATEANLSCMDFNLPKVPMHCRTCGSLQRT
jgi:hypothetical protein